MSMCIGERGNVCLYVYVQFWQSHGRSNGKWGWRCRVDSVNPALSLLTPSVAIDFSIATGLEALYYNQKGVPSKTYNGAIIKQNDL